MKLMKLTLEDEHVREAISLWADNFFKEGVVVTAINRTADGTNSKWDIWFEFEPRNVDADAAERAKPRRTVIVDDREPMPRGGVSAR